MAGSNVKFKKQATMGALSECLERLKELREAWAPPKKPDFRGDEQPLWFRGHLNARWKLTPKIYRPEYLGADESEIRNEFQSRALQVIQGRMPADKWEWYFLMQHYGVPTRLLDWTENALIALYFAVENHPGNCDAGVWALDPAWLNKGLRKSVEGAMLHDWHEAQPYLRDLEVAYEGKKVTVGLPAAIEPPHVDRRLAAQSSRFVIFGTTKDMMRTKSVRQRNRKIGMVTIPQPLIKGLQEDLINVGITSASVFPDITGLCQEICSKFRRR
jgi:hypothetical protein